MKQQTSAPTCRNLKEISKVVLCLAEFAQLVHSKRSHLGVARAGSCGVPAATCRCGTKQRADIHSSPEQDEIADALERIIALTGRAPFLDFKHTPHSFLPSFFP